MVVVVVMNAFLVLPGTVRFAFRLVLLLAQLARVAVAHFLTDRL